MALPAHAVAGKIFDFNLTLPIMVGQFLLLMVFLDKTWFTPVGKVLDERDGYIREQLKKFKVHPFCLYCFCAALQAIISVCQAGLPFSVDPHQACPWTLLCNYLEVS